MAINFVNEMERDYLIGQSQKIIEALLQYISASQNEHAGGEVVNTISRFSDYVSSGGELKLDMINANQEQRARELMDLFKADYFTPSNENGEYCAFLTRSDQKKIVGKVMDALDFERLTDLTWINTEDFLRYNMGNNLAHFTLPDAQLPYLTDELTGSGLMFSALLKQDDQADVYYYAYDREQMQECLDRVCEKLGIEKDIPVKEVKIEDSLTVDTILSQKKEPTNQNTDLIPDIER